MRYYFFDLETSSDEAVEAPSDSDSLVIVRSGGAVAAVASVAQLFVGVVSGPVLASVVRAAAQVIVNASFEQERPEFELPDDVDLVPAPSRRTLIVGPSNRVALIDREIRGIGATELDEIVGTAEFVLARPLPGLPPTKPGKVRFRCQNDHQHSLPPEKNGSACPTCGSRLYQD